MRHLAHKKTSRTYVQLFIPLDHRYNENLELEDGIHTAILTLKVSWQS